MADDDFYVRFWGVRGSIACAGPETVAYGGNTSCLEVRCGDRLLIFDAGTGIRELGNLVETADTLDADLFLTHTHLDHVAGIPFFSPFFNSDNTFRIWAGHLKGDWNLEKALEQLMIPPLFPVPIDIFHADMSYHNFQAGDTLRPADGVVIRTIPLNHPNGATGYRIEFQEKSICYLTDTEHDPARPDANILRLINGADMVIYDSTYTDEEYLDREDWGHSTWQEGVRLCDQAKCGTFVAFHHDPDHNDAFMDEVARELSLARPGSVVAKEGMVLTP